MQKKYKIVFITLLIVHVVLATLYIAHRDICSDEPGYIEYAKRWMHGHPERVEALDDSKTPITVIAWLPRIFEQLKNKEVKYNDWGRSDQEAGRYVMIIFTLITALYIFFWGIKLLGEKWANIPVAMFLLDPLVLGHSGVIGSDIASAAVLIAVLYHLWQYLGNQAGSAIIAIEFISWGGLYYKAKFSVTLVYSASNLFNSSS